MVNSAYPEERSGFRFKLVAQAYLSENLESLKLHMFLFFEQSDLALHCLLEPISENLGKLLCLYI